VTARTLVVGLVVLFLLAGCGGSPSGAGTADGTATTAGTTAGTTVPTTAGTATETATATATATATDTPTGPVDSDGDGLNDSREGELGTNASVADTDSDGLEDGRELELGTDPTVADTDDDGLGDGAEVLATETLPGADPLHRDVFVEIDYMAGERPEDAMLDRIEDRFASAPVSNPDGTAGIDLHLRVDEEVPRRERIVAANRPGELNDIFDYRDRYSQLDQRGHFYGLVVDSLQYPNASVRDLQGYALGDFFASENPADPGVQDSVVMHELGHVLGLGPWRHPGIDSRRIPFEAYPSAMNYRAPGDRFRFSDGSEGAADFDDWRAIASCHGWAGYDDSFPSVDAENASDAAGGKLVLSATVGCL